ncbi:MFS transporter [Lacrimispora sp.]|uniref:MFS transporter n=1 Tax=Lacrimispora sp. TaxID=2719234 RepID=UPI0028AC6CFD|nr:MFS transporter [Lacrimispora sp.]
MNLYQFSDNRCLRILLANFITNIGNGLHILTVGKILYDFTGQTLSFGFVYIIEALMSITLQIYAGFLVDNYKAKNVLVFSDLLRGITVILCCLGCIYFDHVFLFIIIITFVINIAKPFYRSASFVIITKILDDEEEINKFNGFQSSFIQAGQIIGIALVGVLMLFISPYTILIINGASFSLSAICLITVKVNDNLNKYTYSNCSLKNLVPDWVNLFKQLLKNKQLLTLVVVATGDYLFVNFFNLSLAPLVSERLNNESLWLSVLDMSFAISSILPGVLWPIISKRDVNYLVLICLFFNTLSFIVLSFARAKIIILFMSFMIGGATAASNILLYTKIQFLSEQNMRGKIASMRNLLFSLLTVSLIPLVTQTQSISLSKGFVLCGIIVFIYLIIYIVAVKKNIVRF